MVPPPPQIQVQGVEGRVSTRSRLDHCRCYRPSSVHLTSAPRGSHTPRHLHPARLPMDARSPARDRTALAHQPEQQREVLMEKSPNKSTITTTTTTTTAAKTEQENATLSAPPKFKLNPATQDQTHSYISPSDALLSPTTKKLEEMKGKRFANAGKNGVSGNGSGSLLRKMVKSQSGKSLGGS